MIERNMPFSPEIMKSIKHAAKHLPPWLRADAEQEACLAVWRALPRFDATRGVELRTFAENRARGAVLDYCRSVDPLTRNHRRAIKAGRASAPVSVSVDFGKVAGRSRSPEGEASDRELWGHVAALPPRQAQSIIGSYAHGVDPPALAASMGCSVPGVYAARNAALRTLRTIYIRAEAA